MYTLNIGRYILLVLHFISNSKTICIFKKEI